MDIVTLNVPGAIVVWLAEFNISDEHLRNPFLPPVEREWREALTAAQPSRRGRGVRFTIAVSPEAAEEFLRELNERADTERALPPEDRNVHVSTVDRFVERAADSAGIVL
jgi:hypothetical protein